MFESFLALISAVSDFMWGPWTMIFIAFVSVYLTVRTRFFLDRGVFDASAHTLLVAQTSLRRHRGRLAAQWRARRQAHPAPPAH